MAASELELRRREEAVAVATAGAAERASEATRHGKQQQSRCRSGRPQCRCALERLPPRRRKQ